MCAISQGSSIPLIRGLGLGLGILRKSTPARFALCIVAAVLMHATPSFAQRIIAPTAGADASSQAGYAGRVVSVGIAQDKQLLAEDAAPQLANVVRARAISLDRTVLQKAAQHLRNIRSAELGSQQIKRADDRAPLANATILNIAFFDDAVFNIVIQASEQTHSGGTALVGYVPGDLASSAVVVDNDGVLSVGVYVAGKRYRIDGDATIGYTAMQVPAKPAMDEAALKGLVDDVVTPPAAIAEATAEADAKLKPDQRTQSITPKAADDGSIIDVMVVYTQAARVAAGGVAQMNANVDAQIAFTNLIYLNSNVVQRLRLVYKGEVNYVERDVFKDLYSMAHPSDGIADEVPILRDIYQADVVSVWGVWPQVGGVAYGNPVENQFSGVYAYNIINAPAATQPGMTVFAHELGHNMGLMHDVFVQPGTTKVTPEGSTVLTEITYAHGYVDVVNRFRTVMSTADQCAITFGADCAAIPFHSNPALTFDNRAVYPAAVSAAIMGDAVNANERRTLNDTRESVANYRPSLASQTGAGVLAFTQRAVEVAEGAGSVTLTVGRYAGSAGAVSVAYSTIATTPITATANLDYTTTAGTLTWADGDTTTRVITVPIIQDALLEGRETFSVNLTAPTGGAGVGGFNGTGASVIVTILDDEPDTFPAGGGFPPGFATPGASSGAWQVDTTRGYLSTASLRSAAVLGTATSAPYNQFATSDMEYTGTFATGNISFAYLLSSYGIPSGTPMSGFQFFVDGVVKIDQPGGVYDWQTASVFVAAGVHTLRWRFYNALPVPCQSQQPAGSPPCSDRVWVDAISLPTTASGPSSNLAYITNSGNGTVSAIRISSNTVVATIPVGASPQGVAVHPDGTRVYVTNGGSGSVSVVDTLTQTVVANVAVGTSPLGIAINPSGTRVYVGHFGSAFLAVIDTATNTRLPDIPAASRATGLAISADGTRAYLANGSNVQVIDLVNNLALTNVLLNFNSFGVALSNDGSKAYIVQNQAKAVSVFNTATNQRSFDFTANGQPIGVAVNPVLNRVYVTTGATNGAAIGNSVMVFTGDTHQLVATVPVGTFPYGVAVDASGAWVYVANSGSDTVSVIDASSNTIVATIPVGARPQSLGQFITPLSIPGAPIGLAALRGNDQLALSFTLPADGGTVITQYTATCQPGNIVATGTSSPVVVTGLTSGVNYTCSVRATNARGVGAPSATVTAAPGPGTFINSAAATTFTVLTSSSFVIATSGLIPTSVTTSGLLPPGVTLSASGVLSGVPSTGSAGSYPFTIIVANGQSVVTQAFVLTVSKLVQTINFAALADRSVSAAPFVLTASGGASGTPVVFTSSTPSVCNVSGSNGATVTPVAPGLCTLVANQNSTIDYLAAPPVIQSFILRASQTITFSTPPNLVTAAVATVTASGGASGMPVVFSSATPAVCTTSSMNGATITGVSVGTCTIFANQAGNANFDAAPQVSINIVVNIAPQVISLGTGPFAIGIPTALIRSAGASGNPVVFTTSTPAICTVSGTDIIAIEFGICTVTANQAGNANFSPAAPVTVSIRTASRMLRQRTDHTASRLPDGRVMVAGGINFQDGVLTAVEIFDPATKRWSPATSMARERLGHRAVTLQDGRVLVVGGLDANNAQIASAEIFDPTSGAWSAAGSMALGRTDHSATLLADGRVLIAGGTPQSTATTEIYNPATNSWSAGTSMRVPRAKHAASPMADGKVLVAAGWNNSNLLSSAEIFDPATNTWAAISSPGERLSSSATLLNDGQILVAGGTNSAIRYNAANNMWSAAGALSAREDHTATRLADGRVVVAGGGGAETSTFLYDQTTNTWTATAALLFARLKHTATLLNDGSVLIAGGNGPGGGYRDIRDIAELYRLEMTLLALGLPPCTVNVACSPASLSVIGGVAPFTYSVTDGALPAGMSLTAAGLLSGTPTALGTSTFTVTVSGANAASTQRQFSLTVVPPLFNVTPSAGSNGTINPATPQPTYAGSSATFTITPSFGYAATVGGTCGGALVGNTYTTAPITGDCTVIASFNAIYTVPSAPIIGTAVAGATSVVVNFTPPVSDGGTPITSYTASCSPGIANVTDTASPITVRSLTAGVAVTCTVTATNGMGPGPASAASNSVAPLGPARNINIAMNGTGTGNVISTPAGINCPGTCLSSFPEGTTVSFTATATGTSIFSGWVGPVCQGGNATTTCTFTVTVNRAVGAIFQPSMTAPAAPVGVSAVAGSQSATVSFLPGATGGSPVTQYTANCYVGGNLANPATPVVATSSPIVVTGLAAGVAVNCRVTATNAIGTSVNSGASALVTPTAAPASFTVTPSAGANGSISPNAPQLVNAGSSTMFTITPNSGYSASVSGSCGGTLVGSTYTTNMVTANCTVIANFTLNVALTAVQSRKTHGAAGTFDLLIDTAPLIAGSVTVEPRMIGAGHSIVFQFNQAVTSIGSVTAVDTSGNPIGIANGVINSANNTEVIVTLTGVADASRVTITVNNVAGAGNTLNQASASMGFLIGDVNNSRSVSNTDITAIKTRAGQTLDNTNFKLDVNVSGGISNTDISAAKTRSGAGI
jgi:YVTN family beta-propeller protein